MGKGAQLFNDCEWSQDSNTDQEVDIDFTKWDFFDKITDQMWLGTSDPESATYCKSIPAMFGITTGGHGTGPHVQESPHMFVQLYHNMFDYISEYYMPAEFETTQTGEVQLMGDEDAVL